MKFWAALILTVIVSQALGQSILLTHQLSDIPSSIRGLSIVDDNIGWFSGSKGYIGRTTNGDAAWQYNQLRDFEAFDFRSLYAFDSLTAIVANAGSPAYILKTIDGGKTWRTVYSNNHPEIFFDGIDFWDSTSGLIYGDPIDGRMFILRTRDRGETWNEISMEQRPRLAKGEASFAASGTGIRCLKKNQVVISTGGLVSRLWISSDGGEHWASQSVPIVQGKSTTGIFSIATQENHWIVVGGDYQLDSLKQQHIYYSTDGGKHWKFPMSQTNGYRSCVEFVKGKTWIAVGQGGIDLSQDDGQNWVTGLPDKAFHVIRKARNGTRIFIAGNGKISIVELKK